MALLAGLIEAGGISHVSEESAAAAMMLIVRNGPLITIERDLDTGYIIRLL